MMFRSHVLRTALLAFLIAVIASTSFAQKRVLEYPWDEGVEKPTVMQSILMYPVNRVADFIDMASFNLGFGIGLHLNAHATRALQLGVGASTTSKIGTSGAKREAGVYQETTSEFSLLLLSANSLNHTTTGIGNVSDYRSGIEPDRLYLIKRDFWGFGAEVTAGIVSLGIDLHPGEMIDFVAGIFFLDIMKDDM